MTKYVALLFFVYSFFATPVLAADRPNFVWLISEDNSQHYLKLFDPNGAETPNIRALAEHGVIFENAFSNSPVCSVARTTLMTSCFAPRIGTQFHRKSVTVPLPAGLEMFPSYLRKAGYYTTNNKKKDYNAFEGDGVWDSSSAKATWKGRKADQPFFHMQSFGATHEGRLHFKDMSRKTRHDPDAMVVAPYHPNTPTFRYTNARYRDSIQDMDREIGEVVAQLEQDGVLEDTFVFYFGDHGGVLPRGKGYAYESGLHIPLVVRVPANWKSEVPERPGTRTSRFVSFVDFGPTLLSLAGLSIPTAIDGRAILGAEQPQQLRNKFDAFGYADRFDEKIDFVRTIRKGRYEYVRSYQPFNYDGLHNNYRYEMLAYVEWRNLYLAGKLNGVQRQFFEQRPAEALFDIQLDPHEVTNLAEQDEYGTVLAEMREALTEHEKSMPDLSFYPESYLVEHAFQNPVGFGLKHKQQIAKLVDIANLQLQPFEDVEVRLSKALASEDQWERYWALIVCSSFGKQAQDLLPQINSLANAKDANLVRLRAAEFLALTGAMDTRDIVLESLQNAQTGVEANLVLNTLVLLRDGPPKYKFRLPNDLSKSNPGIAEMERRILYLQPR